MDYEIIQQHEYQDIYRLKPGVLLKVSKFGWSEKHWDWVDTEEHKKKLLKISGLSNCYKLKEDVFTRYYKEKIDKDTIIFEGNIIIPIQDKDQFYYELKTTGSCFSGDLGRFTEYMGYIQDIIKRY